MQDKQSKEALVDTDEPLESECCCSSQVVSPRNPKPSVGNKSNPSWNDWRWQMQNRIRSLSQLIEVFPDLSVGFDVDRVAAVYPMAITPYYASLIRRLDASDPVFAMSVPQVAELVDPPFLRPDPLGEEKQMPLPGLIHRYADRALVMATTMCAMYCRHCTRKRVAGTRETALSSTELERITRYLKETPDIRDVIISGGDPFTLPTEVIEKIIAAIRSVPTVEIIRIGTRTPVVLPQRITPELTSMLKRYHPLWINTHFNHPAEITSRSREACELLADAGIPLGNQTVLLRGINDDAVIIKELCRELVKMRVRPYYLFQCDLVKGVEHFRTSLERGIEIMDRLRGRLSGLAIPSFVVDAPDGGGKIPLLPNYVISRHQTHTVLRTFSGRFVSYPEPEWLVHPASFTARCSLV